MAVFRGLVTNRVETISDLFRLVVLGLAGGFIATGAMTAFRMPISRSLPPTEHFWAEFIGSDLPDHHLPAVILHLFYGAIAGSLFAVLFPLLDEWTPGGTETTGLVGGICYSIPFTAVGECIIIDRFMDLDLDANESMIFHASHLVYGITLGAWIGSRYNSITNDTT